MYQHAVWLSDLLSAKAGKSGRVDDEGNDLLLNSESGAGGVVVSKEQGGGSCRSESRAKKGGALFGVRSRAVWLSDLLSAKVGKS
jgi:hypothetical protein